MSGKISNRQFALLFAMAVMSPLIRFLPVLLSVKAEQAAWVAPAGSFFLLVALMFFIHEIFKKHKGKNLVDICNLFLTKPVGLVVSAVYTLWVILQLGIFFKFFGDRIVGTIMSEVSFEFILVTMAVTIGIVLSRDLAYIARLNEIIFTVFISLFFIINSFSLFSKVKVENILPVSRLDIMPLLGASVTPLSILGIYLFLYFFYDDVKIEEKSFGLNVKMAGFLCVTAMLIMLITIGSIGYAAIPRLSTPYFTILKNVEFLGFLERLDSALLIMWILSDFAIIEIFTYIGASAVKSIFNLKDRKYVIYFLLVISYIIAVYVFKSRFELEQFTKKIILPVNIVLSASLPICLYVVGKIRKLI